MGFALPWPPADAAPAPVIREDLEYQVSLGPCSDVGRVHLVLKELEPGRYLAEVSGTTQGLWQLSNRWLPERYQTEMVYREGRLVPLVYREEFISKGQHVLKEYRFDHEGGHLSLWRQTEGGDTVKKWEVPLKSPVYDFLSLFYNVRLGVFGPLPGGSTLKVMVLSTPAPQEMVFVIGPATEDGPQGDAGPPPVGIQGGKPIFFLPQPGAGAHPGLDPGAPVRQAHGALTEPRRDQEGGVVGPAPLPFSRP